MADFTDADMTGVDLSMAYAKGALFRRTKLCAAILRRTVAKNAFFISADMTLCDVAFAEFLGARFDGTTTERIRNADRAVYIWYLNPHGGPASFDPIPGWPRMDESALGTLTFRENAARERLEA